MSGSSKFKPGDLVQGCDYGTLDMEDYEGSQIETFTGVVIKRYSNIVEGEESGPIKGWKKWVEGRGDAPIWTILIEGNVYWEWESDLGKSQ